MLRLGVGQFPPARGHHALVRRQPHTKRLGDFSRRGASVLKISALELIDEILGGPCRDPERVALDQERRLAARTPQDEGCRRLLIEKCQLCRHRRIPPFTLWGLHRLLYAPVMSVDQALFALAEEIESDQPWPRPRCPACGSGHIRFKEPKRFETHDSLEGRHHPGFEPEWVHGTFLARGQCENPNCRQAAQAAGEFRVAYARMSAPIHPDYEGRPPYSHYYRVAQIYPAPVLMQIPTGAPEEVGEGALRASRVLFADPGLAATALRGTVERFLTGEGVAATWPTGRFRSLEGRIKEWQEAQEDRGQVSELLFAVKWLGNTGTHEDSGLSVREVLEGASLLEEAFHRLYTGPDIDARARQITAAHGSRRSPVES